MYFRYSLETDATPEQVFRAFTDFSDRRLDVWRKTLDPKKYELREHGDTWAVVKEGSAGTKMWVLLRYEWQEPGTIHWSVLVVMQYEPEYSHGSFPVRFDDGIREVLDASYVIVLEPLERTDQ